MDEDVSAKLVNVVIGDTVHFYDPTMVVEGPHAAIVTHVYAEGGQGPLLDLYVLDRYRAPYRYNRVPSKSDTPDTDPPYRHGARNRNPYWTLRR